MRGPCSLGQRPGNDHGSWDNGEVLIQQQDGQILPLHGLDTSRGQVALYSSVPAWHQLGNVVPGGITDVEDVLKLGGIDFDVARRPVEFRNSLDGPRRVLPEHFVSVRQDTGAGLGVVGSKYEVLQNHHAFAFLHALGRSRGRWTTKLRLGCVQGRKLLALLLTAGQRGDSPQFAAVLARIRSPSSCRTTADPTRPGAGR